MDSGLPALYEQSAGSLRLCRRGERRVVRKRWFLPHFEWRHSKLSVWEMVVWRMYLILFPKSLDTKKHRKEHYFTAESESWPLKRRIGKKTQSDLKTTLHFNTNLPNQEYLPGNSVLTLKTKIKTKILEFLELIIILISEILESPTIREAMTFLWSMFQLLISISHII